MTRPVVLSQGRTIRSPALQSANAGWLELNGVRKWYRSRWERNYARYLEWLRSRGHILAWDYEPTTFWFEEVRRGVRSYKPDFSVTELDQRLVFHEIKGRIDRHGRMEPKSATKLRRMARYYPHITVIVIGPRAWRELAADLRRLVPGWES